MSIAPWNEEAWQRLHQRRQGDSLPHAMLLSGPAGLGKRDFADEFARAMLCASPGADGRACGACRSCRFVVAGTHPDLVRINLELRDDGKPRTEITVDQMRALSERLVLTAQFGGAQIAIVDPADGMNVSASNALLKTLEEPTSRTIIILIADHPSRLSATIRSRCQRIDFRTPVAQVALDWLRGRNIETKDADEALRASEGNPGIALAWLQAGAMKIRAEVAKDLAMLNSGGATAYDVAQRWSRDDADLRLQFAASLVREQAARQAVSGARSGPIALTAAVELPKLTAWFDQANGTRELLRGPLRPELALLELLVAWAQAAKAPQKGAA